jgi:hypothetical protein
MSNSNYSMNRRPPLGLKAGDWVVVRSEAAILATLDRSGRLDNLPFQPEMLAYCGARLRVAKVAHKTCDTIRKTGGRRIERAYHLEGARCNGAGHGGCQADCVFFWKDDWLSLPEQDDESSLEQGPCTLVDLGESVREAASDPVAEPVWVCQTTSLYDATTLLPWWDVRQYVRDVTTGNHSAWHMCKLLVFAGYSQLVGLGIGYRALIWFYDRFQRIRGGEPFPVSVGDIPEGKPTPAENLDLQVGEEVEVKSREEIMATITRHGFNRGMRYDMEMLKYSGGRYRVEMRVDKLINEQTGKMMQMKTPCIQLADVYCRAECTAKRLGCPRASNTYWREIWLRRVSQPGAPE